MISSAHLRQLQTLVRMELLRTLLRRRSLPVYGLAALPVALFVLRIFFIPDVARDVPNEGTTEIAGVFHFFILRFVVFFAAAMVFVRLFRSEILERSLHYSLLAPVRRDVLVLGKYLGGLLSATVVLAASTAGAFILAYAAHGRLGLAFVVSATGIRHLALYILIVAFACLAYGALFTLAGLFFKNPMVPAIAFLGWEMATPFLPKLLKMMSVVHYLGSFAPVPISHGPFALLAQPVSPWLAGVALVASTAILLALCSWKARRLEIMYSAE